MCTCFPSASPPPCLLVYVGGKVGNVCCGGGGMCMVCACVCVCVCRPVFVSLKHFHILSNLVGFLALGCGHNFTNILLTLL